MDWDQRARRQHRPLNTLLAAVVQEPTKVGEIAELGAVCGGLCACLQRFADLRDHNPDLARGNLDPRVLRDRERGPQLEPNPWHQQLGLIAGLACERHRIVSRVVTRREPLGDQANLCGPDHDERPGHDDEYRQSQDRDDNTENQHQKGAHFRASIGLRSAR